jgi:hypothetical protein
VSIRIAQPEVRPDREALADELRTSASDRESWSQWAERHALRGPSERDD